MKTSGLLFATILLVSGCTNYPTRSELFKVAADKKNDPLTLTLEDGFNAYVKRKFLDEAKVETGIITMRNGETAKYWFRSHHLSDDMGGSWFFMSDGTQTYMAGYFCCEVQLPEEPFETLNDLKMFIRKNNRTSP